MKENELLYYNEYGGFSLDGKEYIIQTNEETTPLPWSHIIANKDFGTIITANGGGYIWHKNSQSNKLTCWSNDSLKDTPSEKIVLNINDMKFDILPYHSLEKFKIVYGFGYAKFLYEDEYINSETIIYVPTDKPKKIYDINLILKQEYNRIELEYQMIPVLGVTREFTKKHIVIEKENDNIILKNKYRDNYSDEDVYIKFSHEIDNYSFDDEKVNVNLLLNDNKSDFNCDAEMTNYLQNNEKKSKEQKNNLKDKCKKYHVQIEVQADISEFQDVATDMKNIRNFWDKKMNAVKIYTPIDSMNIIMNGWLLYQTLSCRMWARTSFYQAGGAFGFRDQLQDSLMLLWFEPEITRNQLLYHAAHQFEEGDVLHWWHAEKNNGTRTRYTDDLLWLPYVLSKYVEFTGDNKILDERVPFVKADVLKENETEIYTDVEITAYDDTLYDHAKKAIKYGVKLAPNGLPIMGGGDWNDGMNKIKGQSIWLGFFIYEVLNRFKKICEIKEDYEKIEEYEGIQEVLRKSLNENGWDGKWYRRAYFEDATPVGSSENDECKIDGISQSWSVISGAGEIDKCIQAMNSLDAYLVDKENMIIKLLTPPFDKTSLNPGYIKEYIPGVRENGGQYTHGAIWSVIANTMLRNGDRAGEYFRILNPIEHARTKENVLRYKVEPYVIAADVYASAGMTGRGGWTWYTGSSSWFYIAGMEYVLGISKHGNILKINPCIPHSWKYLKIEYTFERSKYIVEVKNPNLKSNGFSEIRYDDDIVQSNEILLVDDGTIHKIEIIL